MKSEIKNNEFVSLISMINGYQAPAAKCKGLRFENITMGTKIRLSKIEKEFIKHLTEFEEAKKVKIAEVYPNGISEELERTLITKGDKEYLKLINEINECGNEVVTVEFEPISLSKVEDVTSDFDYSFLLEKIAE